MRFFISILIIFTSFLGLYSCSTDSHSSKQLNMKGSFGEPSLLGQEIFEIKANGESLYAGTDNNLYLKSKQESAWQPMGLQGGVVRTFVVLSKQEFLASVNFNSDSSTIARTTDGGESWYPYRNGYGGNEIWTPTTMDAAVTENDTLIVARTSPFGTVGQSNNAGKSWQATWESWENPTFGNSSFVRINEQNNNILTAGGSTALFFPVFIISYDRGTTWSIPTIIDDYEEAVVLDAIVNSNKEKEMLISLDNLGLRRSNDMGKNWNNITLESGIKSFTHSPRDRSIIYASGFNHNGTLFFAASGDFGDTWETVEFEGGPTRMYVNDMISVLQNGKEVLYFGTNKGVYSYAFEK